MGTVKKREYPARIYKIAFILIFTCLGCVKPTPLAFKGHGLKLIQSEAIWSRDFGPENSGHYRSLEVADFNNDGNIDIIGGSYEPGAIFLWYGDGRGNWERIQRFKIKADISSLAVGDVNNDNWIDIISSSRGDTKGIQVWLNLKGKFGEADPVTEKELYDGIRLGDVNGDNTLDIIAANSTDIFKGGIQVWLGDGKGKFIPEKGPARNNIYRDVEIGDFDHDGNLDIVGAGWRVDGGALRLWMGAGDGRWSEMPLIEKGSFWGLDAFDVNKDGHLDIIAATNFSGVKIYYGDGKGLFPKHEVLAKSGSFYSTKSADLNKDGIVDTIVASSNDDDGIIIWYYDELNQKWVALDDGLPKNGFYFATCFSDFNQDGRLDLAASSYGEGIKVWLRGVKGPDKRKVIEKRKKEKKTISKESKKSPPKSKRLIVPMFYTPVYFDFDKADLRPESKVVLSNVIEFLRRVRNTTVKVEGGGSFETADQQNLPEERVRSITQYLRNSSISEDRIDIINGFADGAVIDDGNPYENNRVDLTIVYKDKEKDKDKDKVDNLYQKNLEPITGKYPFKETGDVIPSIRDYKVFRDIKGVPEYRIGPGDVVQIRIWAGIREKSYQTAVSPHGTISFAYVREVKVAGLTLSEAEQKFIETIGRYIKKPLVKISVTAKNAYSASIFGQISTENGGPGTYGLYGKERLTQFIARVGGHAPTANLARVQLIRENKSYILNLHDALFKGDWRQDVIIDDSDVIFVPSKSEIQKRVFVVGEVNSPGIYTYDTTMSLLEAITKAGPTFYSKTKEIVIIRGDEAKPEALKVSFDDIVRKGDFRKNVSLQNGDIVYVSTNTVGDIRDFMRTVAPFLSIPRLPADIYSSFALPRWNGFPPRTDVGNYNPGYYY